MDKYRKFEFASLRNSKLTDGFWGKRTDNYMEIIQCMLEALLCPTNSARLINFEIAAGERKESFYGANWSDGDCYKFLEGWDFRNESRIEKIFLFKSSYL